MYLVTGGAGFIGSHLVERLVESGHRVRVLDNLSTGRRENLGNVADRIEFVEGDIRARDVVCQAVEGIDGIFHLAAIASVPRSVEAPLEAHAVNVTGTLHVYEEARRAGVRRVVLSSSTAVYGDTSHMPLSEDLPMRPLSPYAATKAACELYAGVYSRTMGVEVVALRYFNVYGPRQDPTGPYAGVIARFIDCMVKGIAPVLYGGGQQTRDFVFVDDVVEANLRAMQAAADAAGEAFNVASGQSVSVRRLAELIAELTGFAGEFEVRPARPGDILHSAASIEKARSALGYTPKISLETGLARTLAAWRR